MTHSASNISRDAEGLLAPSAVIAAIIDHSTRRPSHPALVVVDHEGHPATTISYGELAASSSLRCQKLMTRVAPGDVVLLVASNSSEFVTWFCAGLMSGAHIFPVPHCSTHDELEAAAEHSHAVAVIAQCDAHAVASLQLQRFSLEYADGLERTNIASARHNRAGGVALQSSGTTGMPKIALRDGAALDAVAINVANAIQLAEDDNVLAAMPLCHAYGVDTLLATLLAGATLHIMPTFDAVAAAMHLSTHATVFPGVPFMFESMARVGPVHPPSKLRLAYSAGTQLPERLFHSFQSVWRRPIGQLYGATELGSVTFNDPRTSDFNPNSVGVPMSDVAIAIVDPDEPTRRMPANVAGQISVSAPSMFRGYLGDAPRSENEPFLTGDLGHMDDHGRLFVTGRLKLLIDVGGLKVNPLEVEAALLSHPNVAECVVVPLPLSDTVVRLRAIIVPRDPIKPPGLEQVRQFLRRRLSRHKIPRVIEIATSLPRSGAGKILRQEAARQ